jgi:hypothetical protein
VESNAEEAMSVASKLCVLILAAVVGLALYEWDLLTHDPQEMTQVALRQFDNNDAAAQELRVAGVTRAWWLLGGFAGFVLLAVLVFWEDVRHWCRHKRS